MADVVVSGDIVALVNERDCLEGPFWTSPSVGYITLQIEDGSQWEIFKTADSGATWVAQDNSNRPSTAVMKSVAVCFDQDTPGNSGTLIHLAWLVDDADTLHYVAFDTANDTWGTDRVIDSITLASASGSSDVGITVSVSGRVYVCGRGDYTKDTENTDHSMRSSSDGFASNNESEKSPYSSDEEVIQLLPGADADEDDICAVVYDVINTDLEFWKFDASANSWGVTAIDTGMSLTGTEARTYKGGFDAAIRHSDEHILVVYWTDVDSATGDFKCVDITQANPTVTAKTNLDTDTDDSFLAAILINQQNDDVYVAYAGSDAGDETWNATVVIYYKLSTNGMGSWGSEQAYGVQNDDERAVSTGHSVGDAGGRFMPVFYNDDLTALRVNDGNDVEIAVLPVFAAALTGTALPTATEAEIAAGGETVIITLTLDTWLDAGSSFDGSRQAIIDGFDAPTSPALAWNAEVRDKAPVAAVVRTSATVVTVTWTTAASAYNISSDETITVTVPAAALTTSADPVVADETFDVTAVSEGRFASGFTLTPYFTLNTVDDNGNVDDGGADPSTVPTATVMRIEFSPNGEYVAVIYDDKLAVYAYANKVIGSRIAIITLPDSGASSWHPGLSWHRHGTMIAAAFDNTAADKAVGIYSWDGANLVELYLLPEVASTIDGTAVAWHPFTDHLAVGYSNANGAAAIYSWNGSSLTLVDTDINPGIGKAITDLVWNAAGTLLLGSMTENPSVFVIPWNGTAFGTAVFPSVNPAGNGRGAAFYPDESKIVLASSGAGTAKQLSAWPWNGTAFGTLVQQDGRTSNAWQIKVDPTGTFVVVLHSSDSGHYGTTYSFDGTTIAIIADFARLSGSPSGRAGLAFPPVVTPPDIDPAEQYAAIQPPVVMAPPPIQVVGY